ncbi:subtilisin family serine protease [Microbacterium sp. SORGH_AS 888]|nr:subtilisin family serine protease [Microbacterium sp. SORGH_AS_0888]
MTTAAAGINIISNSSTSWDSPVLSSGTSLATPIVAGMLALAAQKYPNATGNQLIQSLIHNTGRDDHPLAYNPTDGLGYGAASLTRLLSVDPSQYPDENPLLNKDPRLNGADYLPTDAQLAAAQSALGTASNSPAASAPAPAPDPTSTNPVDGILTGVIIAGIIILVLIIAAAIITIVLVTRRAKRPPRA